VLFDLCELEVRLDETIRRYDSVIWRLVASRADAAGSPAPGVSPDVGRDEVPL
jgi:hypothetical protein